jgi:hypothetical protein
MKGGDRNTMFFHSRASERKESNYIDKLRMEDMEGWWRRPRKMWQLTIFKTFLYLLQVLGWRMLDVYLYICIFPTC